MRFPYRRDGTGDAETVNGVAFFRQVIRVATHTAIERSNVGLGEYNSPTDLAELEGQIAEFVAATDYVEGRPSVTVVESPTIVNDDQTLTVDVRGRFDGEVTRATTEVNLL
jgi:hypothetical protein